MIMENTRKIHMLPMLVDKKKLALNGPMDNIFIAQKLNKIFCQWRKGAA